MLLIKQSVPVPVITTEQCVLRPYRESDAVSLQRNLNDERVARDVSNIPFPYTLAHAKSWIAHTEAVVTRQSSRVDLVIDVDGDVAGSVAFINMDGHKAQVSTWVAPAYWKRGLAYVALKTLVEFGFRKLGLIRIYAYHYSENTKTAGLLEKVGFKFEGVHEKEWMKIINGVPQFFDSNYYSIVKDEHKVQSVAIVPATGERYAHVGPIVERLQTALSHLGITSEVDPEVIDRRFDLAIALGGDGTMMHTVTKSSRKSVPTLGINAGDVGFLTSAEASELVEVAVRIAAGDFEIERRLALQFRFRGNVYGPFANEVALWHPTHGIATFKVTLNDDVFFESLAGDGVLVATATGSTAYNASAGGSILTPDVTGSVIINALNPPQFNMRPVVTEKLAAGGHITFTVMASKRDEPLTIAADSLQLVDGPKVGESVVVTRHPQPLLFATFGIQQFVAALKGKMHLAR